MNTLPPSLRIANTAAVLHGPYGAVTRQAALSGTTRQALYRDALQVVHRSVFVESSLDASLAVGQFLSYVVSHLKSLVGWSGGERCYSMKPQKRRGISSFSQISSAESWRLRFYEV
jgi:hypothetical protein